MASFLLLVNSVTLFIQFLKMQRRGIRQRTVVVKPNRVSDDVLLQVIGEETSSEEEIIANEPANDAEYNPSEDYVTEQIDPTAEQTSRRGNGTPFTDPNDLLNFPEFIDERNQPKLNLPDRFPSNPKAIHFSLFYLTIK